MDSVTDIRAQDQIQTLDVDDRNVLTIHEKQEEPESTLAATNTSVLDEDHFTSRDKAENIFRYINPI